MTTSALVQDHPKRPAQPMAQVTSGLDQHSAAPVLDGPSATASALVRLTGGTHPVRAFACGLVLAYAAIAGISILLGLLVTRVLITNRPVARADEALVRFLSHHRSGGLTEASVIGSIIAGGVTLPILVVVCGLVAALFRQWRLAAFLIFALVIESAAYRTTTLVIHRHRPKVVRLENLPANASYPSGHTAAAIAVYCGLALLLTSRIANRSARTAIWVAAVAIPTYVALSRMYRGMHHPLDVFGGVVIGVTTLVAMVIVSRAAGRAAARADDRRRPERVA
jgi:membrane-associated phospholipid phosphatase